MQYSHSRLSTFEQCKFKFKLKYIDKAEGEIENTVEAFMGSRVHDALEKLYKELKVEKLNSLNDLLAHFNLEWDKHWTENIKIVRPEFDVVHYRKLGARCIRDYYERFKPFDGARTIGCEIRVLIETNDRTIQGFIDRLDCQGTHYFIHDYKTGQHLPTQKELDEDRQLALYSIAVKEMYPDAEQITLVWHYLAFDKSLTSTRTAEQLEQLKANVLELIQEVEHTTEFPPMASKLCDWCEYRGQCPAWKHEVSVEQMPPEEFHKDAGVQLVDEYVRLQIESSEKQKELDVVKEKLLKYADQFGVDAVVGSDSKAKIWRAKSPKFPGASDPDRAEFEKILQALGILDEVKRVDSFYLSNLVRQGKLNPIVRDALIKKYPLQDISRVYVSKR
ncbi:MAG: PD-(D/E)XK nuclease family protein [Candidatus Woesearchaeota archaeon]